MKAIFNDSKNCWDPAVQTGALWAPDADPPLGSHLVTPRPGFTHHGIYAGEGQVVHYAGLSRSLRRGPVQVVPLAEFAGGHGVWIEAASFSRYAGAMVVRRALSRVGEDHYRVTTNNCEHFCAWCLDGESRSPQVDRWLTWPRVMVRAMLTAFSRAHSAGSKTPAPYYI